MKIWGPFSASKPDSSKRARQGSAESFIPGGGYLSAGMEGWEGDLKFRKCGRNLSVGSGLRRTRKHNFINNNK
jgi:hypothetical protein